MTNAKKEIKRFNLRFGIFGCPEQCKDGEFITWEDHLNDAFAIIKLGNETIGKLNIVHRAEIEKLEQLLAEMDVELEREKLAHQAAINDGDYWKRQYDASVSKEVLAQVKASYNWDLVVIYFVAAIGWGIVLVQLVNKSFRG